MENNKVIMERDVGRKSVGENGRKIGGNKSGVKGVGGKAGEKRGREKGAREGGRYWWGSQ